jgi:hypothetical protein|tara:strand:- start:4504 stop:4764 length:261 start_codon:yes stop_codon:yes gene_type:complete
MKTINLPIYDIVVTITEDGGGAAITSNLKEKAEGDSTEKQSINNFNAAMDGIESIVMAHASTGIDIESDSYLEGIEAAVEGCSNNF